MRGVKLVVSDAHDGIKAATAKVLRASWQRCRVHLRLPTPERPQRRAVSAFIGTAFLEDHAGAAKAQWRHMGDQFQPEVPSLQPSWMPIERLNGELGHFLC